MNKIKHLEYHICDHCNLNCKGCWHFSPLSKPRFYDSQQFDFELNTIKKYIESNAILHLLGGEPLLHPNILEFCKIAKKYFNNVTLDTNGLLLYKQPDIFFDTINTLNIKINVSNYTEDDKLAELVANKCKNYIIIDKPKLINLGLDFSIEKIDFTCCQKCPPNLVLKNGYIYKCWVNANIITLFKYFNLSPNKFIENKLSIFDLSEETLEIFTSGLSDICKYCEGGQNQPIVYDWQKTNYNINEWIINKDD